MILRLAWRNIWRNRRRSLITISSILFAVLLSVAMRSLQLGTYDRMIGNVVNSFSGYLQVHGLGYWDDQVLDHSIPVGDLPERIGELDGVTDVLPRIESFALAATESKTRGALVVGLSPETEDSMLGLSDKLVAGTLFASEDSSVLLAEGLAQSLSAAPGDTIVVLGQGFQGMSAAGKYAVSGVVSFPQPGMNRTMLLMPLAEGQYLFSADGRATSLVLRVDDGRRVPALRRSVEELLPAETYEVMDWRELMPELVQTIQADNAGGIIMILILYIVILFGIFGTLLMMMNERQYEFGVLVSIGLTRTRLAMVVMAELVILTLFGVVAGALVSTPLQAYFHRHPIRFTGEGAEAFAAYGWEPVMVASTDPGIAVKNGLFVLLLTLVISVYAIVRIHRLAPVQAMRA